MMLPQTGEHRGRHTVNGGPSRRVLVWAIALGAVIALVFGGLTALLVAGGGADRPGQGVGAPTGQAQVPPTQAEPAISDEPSASASPTPSPQRSQSPTELISGLQAKVTGLVRDGQLDADAAQELTKRLVEAKEALADNDTNKAWDKLTEFAEKVVNLRKESKLSESGYQTIATAVTALAKVLPRP